MKKVTEKKKFKLKKSARLTIAGVCAATALVVAVIPTRNVEAITDPETEIPATVNEAIAQDPFVQSNSVVPKATGQRYWAFPAGDSFIFEEKYGGVSQQHMYYKINRDGMTSGYDAMPVFEIAPITTGTEVNCISHYVGGEGSGYTPAGGTLKLSPTVIYAHPDSGDLPGDGAEYFNLDKGDEANHTPYTWTRYKEHLIEHAPNDSMNQAKTKDAGGTPTTADPYYYYNIDITIWKVPWTNAGTEEAPVWVEPVEPNFATDPPTDVDSIHEVCKKQTGTNFGYQSVSYIADEAFMGVANFSTMEVLTEDDGSGTSNGIVQIGDSAFENCFSL
ncbi:MAG: hypothetical protein K5649_03970, partial [Lachnospiraceae bacterium]|nr:hypothetical protein [Lachnospiraceae bacterium]